MRPTESQNKIHELLKQFWLSPSLPSRSRLYFAGALHAAGQRQGDEIFPIEIMQSVMDFEGLSVATQHLINNRISQFVFIDRRLRPQYEQIVLHVMTKHLDKHYGSGSLVRVTSPKSVITV